MATSHIDPGGVVVPPSALSVPRARWVADLLAAGRLPYARLVECRRRPDPGGDVVAFDVDVQRPQRVVNPVRRIERLAAVFDPTDASYPEVLALRADFPWVPHTNLRADEFPRSLCLYDQPWEQVAQRWTPATFVERVRDWLSGSAKGTLHQSDQPLEPLLFGGGLRIALPADLFPSPPAEGPVQLRVRFVSAAEDARVLVATRPDPDADKKPGLACLAVAFTAAPQTHGLIRRAPRTLADLCDLLAAAGVPLGETLRARVLDWNAAGWQDRRLVVVVAFPKRRDGRDVVEATDVWCFLVLGAVREVGLALGVWQEQGGELAYVLGGGNEGRGEGVAVEAIVPHFAFSRAAAAAANGVTADALRAVAVGVGALGSQVVTNLARAGFGRWTLVDDDEVLPHNLARHALDSAVGYPKALGMAVMLDGMYREGAGTGWVRADVLDPGDQGEKLESAFAAADLILDAAASVPVSRHLAGLPGAAARRVSLFLNPRGTDLVLLAEDRGRTVPLDALEMQYLRAVATDPALRDHLAPPDGRVRYARSCRDVSATIPTHLVALHAAVGANAVRAAAAADGAAVRVWRADPATGEVRAVAVSTAGTHRTALGGWTLVLDDALLARMAALRAGRLPNETGGVLIGAYDIGRRVLYAVDTVPSPPDSKEWPTLYIRGCEGLAARVEEIGRATGGQLEYVGEWHSHPDGCPCEPSADDLVVFAWLADKMADAGLPTLMAIAGTNGETGWFIGEMSRGGGWRVG